jgi:predicted permease
MPFIHPRFVEDAARDARYGLRQLRRSPVFTVVAVLSLVLGIGANAAIFHLVDAIQLRQLAVARPHELVEVRPDGPQAFGSYDGVNAKATGPLWERIKVNREAFAALFAWGDAEFLIGRGAAARAVRGLWVSGDYFGTLGVAPVRGRLFGPDDDRPGCEATAVISHAFWLESLGGDESRIGSAITVFDRSVTVVGVAPASFTGLEVGETFDLAMPICATALWDGRLRQPDRWWLTIMGRLKTGWTTAQANAHMRASSPALVDATVPPGYDASLVDGYRRLRFGVVPAAHGVSRLRDAHASSLTLLLGLTSLVLLMTCGNLATLMLARGSAREREIAVRAAIGASRSRLVSQLLIESLLVAAAGAALSVPAAVVAARALVALLGTSARPVALSPAIDWRLAAFVVSAAALTAVISGLLPALRVALASPNTVMRQGGRGATIDPSRVRLQRSLVAAQIAVSLVLLFSALLFVQTFRNLAAVPTGFDPSGTLVITFMDRTSEALPADRKTAFQDQLAREIGSLPDVAAAVSSTHVPLSGATWSHFFRVPGTAGQRKASRFAYVGPGYFETLRIPLRAGRAIEDSDNARSRRVMVVNESFVRSHLGRVPPIGATIRTLEESGFPEATYEIVGVVGDTKYADLRDENCWCENAAESAAPIAYVPIAQNPSPYAWAPVIVRSRTSSAPDADIIARQVERLSPAMTMQAIDLTTAVREKLVVERMVAWLAGSFALLALSLVVVGLYGVVAYIAAGRKREIGIRLALGSTRGQIVALVLRANLGTMAVGIAIGVPLALAAMRAGGGLLYGLSPADSRMAAGAACLVGAVGTVSALIPAWRAVRVSLADAVRGE